MAQIGKIIKTQPQHSVGSVLIFHGLTGNPNEVLDIAERLHDRGFNTLLPLISGHGRTALELSKVAESVFLEDARNAYKELTTTLPPPYFLLGLSFGALLSLVVAEEHPNEIDKIVLCSPPFLLRSKKQECILNLLSYLPNFLLNFLGTVPKKPREHVKFIRERHDYREHSMGAAARLIAIRRRVLKNLHSLKSPVLLLYDPLDHHVRFDAKLLFNRGYSVPIVVEEIEGGEHELTVGPKFKEVADRIEKFFLRKENAA